MTQEEYHRKIQSYETKLYSDRGPTPKESVTEREKKKEKEMRKVTLKGEALLLVSDQKIWWPAAEWVSGTDTDERLVSVWPVLGKNFNPQKRFQWEEKGRKERRKERQKEN